MKRKLFFLFAALFLFWGILLPQTACEKDDNNGLNPPDDKPYIDFSKMPYPNLSDYQFFVGTPSDFMPNQGVIDYDLNGSLFANYALKKRYLYIPPGKSASYKSDGVVDFPIGTVIIKHFYYQNDLRNAAAGKLHIETRLLVRNETDWEVYSYLWNEEQTEATFSVIGKQIPVSWIDENGDTQHINYLIPNKNECKGCHSLNNVIVPLGPQIMQLNKEQEYNGQTKNQLEHWRDLGILTGLPTDIATVPKIPNPFDVTADINLRARSYMDVNCAGCHNPQGPANNSGLDLRLVQTDPVAYGVCKSPVAAGPGSGTLQYDIVPAHPERSIVIYRMSSLAPDIAMPELLRTTVDTAGVSLLRDWIASLPPGECE